MLIQMTFNLCLTVTAELTAAIFLKVKDKRDRLAVVLINCVTNPLVNYAMNAAIILYRPKRQFLYLLLTFLEAAALISEGVFYKKLLRYDRIKPMTLSLILNGASFLCGAAVTLIYYVNKEMIICR